VDPYTNAPVSVSPLTWSHATLVATVQEYMEKSAALSLR
jgi:glucoamylase